MKCKEKYYSVKALVTAAFSSNSVNYYIYSKYAIFDSYNFVTKYTVK